jgi:hypothetical protein
LEVGNIALAKEEAQNCRKLNVAITPDIEKKLK